MNKQEFISYISSPGKLDEKSLPLLQKVAEEFSYFQTAQLLLAKNLHNINSIHYNNQLKLASVSAGDRKMLHKLIYSKKSAEENITETEAVYEPELKKEVVEEKKQKEETIAKTNPSDEILKKALEEIEAIKKKMEEKTKSEENRANIQKEEIKLEKKKAEIPAEERQIEKGEEVIFPEVEKMKKQVQTLDELYTTQAIESSMEIDLANAEAEEKLKEKEVKIQKEEIRKEGILKEVQHDEKKEIIFDSSKKHSFTDWLKMKQAGLPKESIQKKPGDDLIEKFIKEEPKIGKIKADFFSPINMAKQSVTDENTFVTETLARIYEKQGAYNKAIEAYEKLILVYPEKSASFAARIEEIKKLIN